MGYNGNKPISSYAGSWAEQQKVAEWKRTLDHYGAALGVDLGGIASPAATASKFHQAQQALLHYERHGELPRWAR